MEKENEPLRGKIFSASTNDSLVTDTSFFLCKDIKSAVEWFKDEYVKYMESIGVKNVERKNGVSHLIDDAFVDVK